MTYTYKIDTGKCKGCGLCVSVCAKGVLKISDEISSKGYYPACQAHPETCVFCATCCLICPDVAITISNPKEEKGNKPKQE